MRILLGKGILLIMIASVSLLAFAGDGWEFNPNKKMENLSFTNRHPEPFIDDILPEQDINKVELTTSDKHIAKVWGLSDGEIKRYALLMNNKSGQYYKNKDLSPIEILGVNARTNIERDYYADKLVKTNSQRIAKELAFNSSYRKAYKSFVSANNLPVVRDFDTDKYSPYNYEPINLKDGDNLMLFIRRKDAVRRILMPLMSEIESNKKIKVNVYFLEEQIEKNEIYDWATSFNIPVEWVRDKKVTLNKDHSKYKAISKDDKSPALYLIRDGETSNIDLSGF